MLVSGCSACIEDAGRLHVFHELVVVRPAPSCMACWPCDVILWRRTDMELISTYNFSPAALRPTCVMPRVASVPHCYAIRHNCAPCWCLSEVFTAIIQQQSAAGVHATHHVSATSQAHRALSSRVMPFDPQPKAASNKLQQKLAARAGDAVCRG